MKKVYNAYCKAEEFLFSFLFAVMVALVFSSAIARGIGKPLAWSLDVAQLLLCWTSLVGADVAFRHDKFIGLDLFTRKMPVKVQKVLEIVVLVLMQVAFHTVIEEERGRFDFEQVCREVCEKLVFRHPNIFASSAAENAGINGWDALKNKEKGRTTLADELATVPATLPALMRAQKLQKRAAGHGLGQQDAAAAQHQLEAAVQDFATADAAAKQEAAGQLLFAAVNAARLAGVDAEEALTFASKRFTQQCLEQEQSGIQVE